MDIINVGGSTCLPEAKAIVKQVSSVEMMKEPDEVLDIDGHKIVPWGQNNTMPQDVMSKIEKCEIVGANIKFNIDTGYGQSVRPYRRIKDGNNYRYDEILEGEVYEFFQDNDIDLYFLEQLTDLNTFFNVFPEIILSKDLSKITTLRSKEAAFSRWGAMDPKAGRIIKHYYSAKWDDNPTIKDMVISDVLDKYNPLRDLQQRIDERKIKVPRFIVPVFFPTPGKTYYQRSYWWSIFLSGWYDFIMMIPTFKKAILKNQMSVKYIIYISDKYWDYLFDAENIDPTDKEAVIDRKNKEHNAFQDFLTGESNAGKGMIALKKMVNSASGSAEEKFIEIVPIKSDLKGGEYVEDSQEGASMISYAMGVNTSLISNLKSANNLSGTDKREMFQMKQAVMAPFRDRLFKPLHLIRRFNGWGEDVVFKVPDFNFTTLDENKSGSKLNTEE
ncbi:MAG: hypothetical protein PF489_09760 [Salinivirgaceae bacterium]|jgi:hypothetical protein|nr:hypothetical protein [Salinivirgaceae bacterium]